DVAELSQLARPGALNEHQRSTGKGFFSGERSPVMTGSSAPPSRPWWPAALLRAGAGLAAVPAGTPGGVHPGRAGRTPPPTPDPPLRRAGKNKQGGTAVFGAGRVIVGASGSPGSLQALRYGEGLARAQGAVLIPVIAWQPAGGDRDERFPNSGYLRQACRDLAC